MLIHVDKLKRSPRQIVVSEAASGFSALRELDELGIVSFNAQIDGALEASWSGNLIEVAGQLASQVTIPCGRCLMPVTTELDIPVKLLYASNDDDEDTPVDEAGLHPYGLHRRRLEKFVEDHFANHLIVRLPGLVGPGLRKNVIFDFLNDNNLHAIDSRGVFQFYPMVNLWYDIQIALQAGLKLVHLTAEPISVAEIAENCFGKTFHQALPNPPAVYDFQSNYATLFGGHGHYQYSRRETFQAVRAYAQSEPITLKTKNGKNL